MALSRNQQQSSCQSLRLSRNQQQTSSYVMIRDGGKWWSKDHHLVVIKMPKNVDYFLKNGERNFQYFLLNDDF